MHLNSRKSNKHHNNTLQNLLDIYLYHICSKNMQRQQHMSVRAPESSLGLLSIFLASKIYICTMSGSDTVTHHPSAEEFRPTDLQNGQLCNWCKWRHLAVKFDTRQCKWHYFAKFSIEITLVMDLMSGSVVPKAMLIRKCDNKMRSSLSLLRPGFGGRWFIRKHTSSLVRVTVVHVWIHAYRINQFPCL